MFAQIKAGRLIKPRPGFNTPDKILEYYKCHFKVDQSLPATTRFNLISRATNVTGNMFEFLSTKHHVDVGKRIAKGVAMLGAAFWKMTAVILALGIGLRRLFRRSK